MTSFEMSGKYDYTSLRRTLKENGLQENQLSAALRQIASENHIDDIRELDKTQKITIPASVFGTNETQLGGITPFATPGTTDVTGGQNLETLPFIFSSTNAMAEIKENVLPERMMGDGEDVLKLPEVFDAEEYEVVEYDDFYGFSEEDSASVGEKAATQGDAGNDNEPKIDYNQFKTQYGSQVVTDTVMNEQQKEEALQQMFGMLDVNSDQFLSQSELSSGLFAPLPNLKDEKGIENLPTEGEDLLGSDMMSSDMSGDSFNPQG